jgi:hypothetical protein
LSVSLIFSEIVVSILFSMQSITSLNALHEPKKSWQTWRLLFTCMLVLRAQLANCW